MQRHLQHCCTARQSGGMAPHPISTCPEPTIYVQDSGICTYMHARTYTHIRGNFSFLLEGTQNTQHGMLCRHVNTLCRHVNTLCRHVTMHVNTISKPCVDMQQMHTFGRPERHTKCPQYCTQTRVETQMRIDIKCGWVCGWVGG
jgi:hypothetical protein